MTTTSLRFAALCTLALSACDYGIPLPAQIVIVDSQVSDDELALWHDAGDDWNDVAPGVVVDVYRGTRDVEGCGHVFVSRETPEWCKKRSGNTHVTRSPCNVEVTMCPIDGDSPWYTGVARHELAHVFLASEREVDTFGPDKIPADVAAEVRERLRE